MKIKLPGLFALLLAPVAWAQVPDSQPSQSSQQSQQSEPQEEESQSSKNQKSDSKFLGKDMPFFDPDSETITWDGKTWNVTNNRVFQARFEKYLNAPEENDKEAQQYNALIKQILDLLSPRTVNAKSLGQAFSLLPTAAAYKRDAGLCDTIANQVFSAWQSQKDQARMLAAGRALDAERTRLERNKVVSLEHEKYSAGTQARDEGRSTAQKAEDLRLQSTVLSYDQRIAEVNALMRKQQATGELKELQSKIGFQSLMVQLFVQRRFQHVLIATRFYRNTFVDGDQEVKVQGTSKSMFDKTTGMPPTVSTMDAMANEIIRDVEEGVEAYNFLLEREEMDSATKRLSEAFLVGEYMPPVRTLSRDKKRQSLSYAQKANQLVNAIGVKDYTLAETRVHEMENMAKDFDSSRPMAAIETARTVAAMHIAKGVNAAVAGDQKVVEQEFRAATEIWPRNPDLKDAFTKISGYSNVANQAAVAFDQLLSQKNYRQIFDDKARFIAATATDPVRQKQLEQVLDNMTEIEKARKSRSAATSPARGKTRNPHSTSSRPTRSSTRFAPTSPRRPRISWAPCAAPRSSRKRASPVPASHGISRRSSSTQTAISPSRASRISRRKSCPTRPRPRAAHSFVVLDNRLA
jgi:hypothetical protein